MVQTVHGKLGALFISVVLVGIVGIGCMDHHGDYKPQTKKEIDAEQINSLKLRIKAAEDAKNMAPALKKMQIDGLNKEDRKSVV